MTFISRRDLIKWGVITGAGVVLSQGKSARAGSPPVTPFSLPLKIPPVLTPVSSDATTDYYEITMRAADVEIIPGLSTTIWGYNGMYPGPTVMARSGRQAVIRQTNNLAVETSVHLHGGHTPPDSDGHPMDMIMPGKHKDYYYPNAQLPSTLWYHDHTDSTTAPNVYAGLAGAYIISDDLEDALPLPKGRFDIPLIIQDRAFNDDGSFFYNPDQTSGFQGDRILVNGVIQPFFYVEQRKYRFRLLNGSNARRYQLALNPTEPFTQVGSDGGLLSAPVQRASLNLTPAERLDVVIDFSRFDVGTEIVLSNALGSATTSEVMQFRVMPKRYGKWGRDPYSVPPTLRTVERIPIANASVTRTFELSQMFVKGVLHFTINGLLYDPKRIDAMPLLDATEIWVFRNLSSMHHPMHIHDVSWQIIDINGVAPSAWDLGWKDTFNVPPNGTVRVISKFVDYLGDYVFHCHNLEHEDHGMMAQFRVVS